MFAESLSARDPSLLPLCRQRFTSTTPHLTVEQLVGDRNGFAEAKLAGDQTELRKMKAAPLDGKPPA